MARRSKKILTPTPFAIFAVGLAVAIALIGTLGFRSLLKTSAPPALQVIARGALDHNRLAPGAHTLTFRGQGPAGEPIELDQDFTVDAAQATSHPAASSANLAVLYTSQASGSSPTVVLATRRDGQWQKQTLPFTAWFPSLAADLQGNLHVAYLGATDGLLKYATNASGAWVSQVIDEQAGDSSRRLKIAVDSRQTAYVFYANAQFVPTLATNQSGSWAKTAVPGAANNRYFSITGLTLDPQDRLHLLFPPQTNLNDPPLIYRVYANGQWQSPAPDSSIDGQLHIDAQGNFHVLALKHQIGFNQRTLWYRTNQGGSWTSTMIAQEDRAANCFPYGVGVDLAIDGVARPHLTYPRATCFGGEDTWYATDGASGLAAALVPNASASSPERHLAVDGQGHPAIAFVQMGAYTFLPSRLTIASQSGGRWQSHNVESHLTSYNALRVHEIVSY